MEEDDDKEWEQEEPINIDEENLEEQPEEKKEILNIIRTSSELKQTYKYLFARHLSSEGLPDDYSHLRQLVVAFLAEPKFYEVLIKELGNLEEKQRKFFGSEEYDKLKAKNLVYSKELVLKSIHFFKKEYYSCDFITSKIWELEQKYQALNENRERVFTPKIRGELKAILRELNLNLPVVNDCLNIAFVIIIKNSDLMHEPAPREEIIAPSKYRYDDDKNRTRHELNAKQS